jgi:hypothetical protein
MPSTKGRCGAKPQRRAIGLRFPMPLKLIIEPSQSGPRYVTSELNLRGGVHRVT